MEEIDYKIDFQIIENNGEKIYTINGNELDKKLVDEENETFVYVAITHETLDPNSFINKIIELKYDFNGEIITASVTSVAKSWKDFRHL